MLHLLPDGEFDEVVQNMNDSLSDVEAGEITVAVRSVQVNGVNVEKGQVIALHNGNLICSGQSLEEACLCFLKSADTQNKERITLFYGEDISKQEVNRIVDHIREIYSDQEIEFHEGGQPHYQFLISVE
jgi:dihydroxyacetone kinase-like predicted kinase